MKRTIQRRIRPQLYMTGLVMLFCAALLSSLSSRATAPAIGITNFNSLTAGALLGSTPSPATASNVGSLGWDLTITVPGSNVSMSIQGNGANPGGASDLSIRMNRLTAGFSVQIISVKSNDGSAFQLKYAYLKLNIFSGSSADMTITGYKSGVAVTGATKTITGILTNPVWTQFDVSAIAAFGNVDEFRFTQAGTSSAVLSFEAVDEINIGAPVTLPLVLTDFSGLLSGSSVQLHWITAQEENTAYFEIQRGTDGADYTPVGKLAAAGNSSVALAYSYTDLLPAVMSPDYFYRLKMADLDGRFTYSPVLVIGASPGPLHLSVYPNPFHQQVTITLASPVTDKAVITVTDMAGHRVLEQVSPLQKGTNILPLSSLSQLGKGTYLFTIVTGQQKQTIELLKLE